MPWTVCVYYLSWDGPRFFDTSSKFSGSAKWVLWVIGFCIERTSAAICANGRGCTHHYSSGSGPLRVAISNSFKFRRSANTRALPNSPVVRPLNR